MHSEDYKGFLSNLINCLKLGRNTSFDHDQEENATKLKHLDSYAEEGQRGIIFIMDNATIHQAKKVKEVLENYNVLFLPSYSPMLNIIELWFS